MTSPNLLGGYDMPLVGRIPITYNVYLTPLEMMQIQALVVLSGQGVLVDISASSLTPRVRGLISEHRLHPDWLIAAVVGDTL